MAQNNTINTKLKFQDLPGVSDNQKLTAAEFNQLPAFQKSPVQQISGSLDDSDIIIDGTKNYGTTIVVAGATRTITANASGHSQGNNIKQRYTFNVDCTITLVNFDATGNNTGKIDPLLAGTYDFIYYSNRNGVNISIPQKILEDGSGTTANGNAVDLGGTQSGDVIIKKADSETFKVIRADDTGGDWEELVLSPDFIELHRLSTTDGWLGSFEINDGFFSNFIGGAAFFARDNPLTKLSGIVCLKDGTIMIGDLSNDVLGTFTKMFFKHDYSSLWDALSAGEKARIFTDFGYQFENFLSKLDTADQSVAGNVEFQDKVSIGVSTFLNDVDIAGNIAIGSGYAALNTAPTDGAIIEGSAGFGDPSPTDPISVIGGKIKIVSNGDKLAIFENDVAEADAFIKMTNGTGSPSQFSPIIVAKSDKAGAPGIWIIGDTKTDTGTIPLIRFDARVNNGSVSARPLFALFNASSQLITILSNGSIGFGAILPTAKVDSNQSDASGAIPPLKLTQADLSEEMIKFDATIGIGNPIEAIGAKSFTQTHFLKVYVEGVGIKHVPMGDLA